MCASAYGEVRFSQKLETLKTPCVQLLVVTVELPNVLTKLDVEGRRLPVWTQQRALGRKAWSEAKNRRRGAARHE